MSGKEEDLTKELKKEQRPEPERKSRKQPSVAALKKLLIKREAEEAKEKEKAEKMTGRKRTQKTSQSDSKKRVRSTDGSEPAAAKVKDVVTNISNEADSDDDVIVLDVISKDVPVDRKPARDLLHDSQLKGDDVALSALIKKEIELDESEQVLKSMSRKEQIDVMEFGAAAANLIAKRGSPVFRNLVKPFRGTGIQLDLDSMAKQVVDLKKSKTSKHLIALCESTMGVAAALSLCGESSSGMRSAVGTSRVLGLPQQNNLNPKKDYVIAADKVFKRMDLKALFLLVPMGKKSTEDNLNMFFRGYLHRGFRNISDVLKYSMAPSPRVLKDKRRVDPLPSRIRDALKGFAIDLIGAGHHVAVDTELAVIRRDWLPQVDNALKKAMRFATDGFFDANDVFVPRSRNGRPSDEGVPADLATNGAASDEEAESVNIKEEIDDLDLSESDEDEQDMLRDSDES